MTDVPNIYLLWADIETTGLDYESDLILEIAYQITDYLGEPLSPLHSAITIDHKDDELLGAVLDQDGDGQLGLGDILKIGSGMFGGGR